MSESYEVNTLLDDVGRSDPIRVAKALQAAHGRGAELAPLIVARLESVLADPEAPRWADEASPCFLPFLAAEYRATAAHVPIVRILRLPSKTLHTLLADGVTAGTDTVLAETYPGDPGPLLELIEDRNTDGFARGAGLKALAILWKRGLVARADLLGWMLKLAASLNAKEESDCSTADALVDVAVQIHAFEIRESILELYQRDLADEGYIESDYTAEFLKPDAPAAFEAKDLDDSIDDAWARLQNWSFFNPWPFPSMKRPAPALEAFPVPKPLPVVQPHALPAPYKAPPKIGRNDPCACGSGKKYKKCCGG